mmetsp:Transcript_15221/g.38700  ORF Transcript_15221/g.38700 Transcript_15221/m.38700 type:complete len:396 (+) Transcript_15221:135-1322(+)
MQPMSGMRPDPTVGELCFEPINKLDLERSQILHKPEADNTLSQIANIDSDTNLPVNSYDIDLPMWMTLETDEFSDLEFGSDLLKLKDRFFPDRMVSLAAAEAANGVTNGDAHGEPKQQQQQQQVLHGNALIYCNGLALQRGGVEPKICENAKISHGFDHHVKVEDSVGHAHMSAGIHTHRMNPAAAGLGLLDHPDHLHHVARHHHNGHADHARRAAQQQQLINPSTVVGYQAAPCKGLASSGSSTKSSSSQKKKSSGSKSGGSGNGSHGSGSGSADSTNGSNGSSAGSGNFHRRKKHHNPWTLEETQALIEGVGICGGGKWADIKKLGLKAIERRSAVDLKDKWRNLLRIATLPSSALRQFDRKREVSSDMLARVRTLSSKYQVPAKHVKAKNQK